MMMSLADLCTAVCMLPRYLDTSVVNEREVGQAQLTGAC